MLLFEQMEAQVKKYVKYYQDDFYHWDKDRLTLEAKKGATYYWLVREHGTQLVREDEAIIDSEVWNKLVFLTHYLDEKIKCKLFTLRIDSTSRDAIEGTVKPLSFDTLLELTKHKRKPKLYTIEYEGKIFTRPWLHDVKNEEIHDFLNEQLPDEELDMAQIILRFSF